MDVDGDIFIAGKFTVQCYFENTKCRAERNHCSRDCDSTRLIQLCKFLTCASDDGVHLGRIEKKVVSDLPFGDCIGACR